MHAAKNGSRPACRYGVDSCNQHDWSFVCKAALTYCQTAIFGQVLYAAGDINVYDIRKKCIGPLCYDFSRLSDYLEQAGVREALGVGDIKFKECDEKVHSDLMGDWMLDVRCCRCALHAVLSVHFVAVLGSHSLAAYFEVCSACIACRARCASQLNYLESAVLALHHKVIAPLLYGTFAPPWSHGCVQMSSAKASSRRALQYAGLLPDLLGDGVRMLIYAGDQDLICNWLGNRRWVDQLQWDGADAWDDASDEEWAVEGKPAGLVKQAGGMTFAKVYDAGHMVRCNVDCLQCRVVFAQAVDNDVDEARPLVPAGDLEGFCS